MTVREAVVVFSVIVLVLLGLTIAGYFNGAWQVDPLNK